MGGIKPLKAVGGVKPLKALTTCATPAGPSCCTLLQPCWFGWRSRTLTFSTSLCKTYVDTHVPTHNVHPRALSLSLSAKGITNPQELRPQKTPKPKAGMPRARRSKARRSCSNAAPVESIPPAQPLHLSTLLHKPLTWSTPYFLSSAACGTRLLLLNSSHVGAGSEEAAALVVTTHEGAAELFSGQ